MLEPKEMMLLVVIAGFAVLGLIILPRKKRRGPVTKQVTRSFWYPMGTQAKHQSQNNFADGWTSLNIQGNPLMIRVVLRFRTLSDEVLSQSRYVLPGRHNHYDFGNMVQAEIDHMPISAQEERELDRLLQQRNVNERLNLLTQRIQGHLKTKLPQVMRMACANLQQEDLELELCEVFLMTIQQYSETFGRQPPGYFVSG